MKIYTITSSKMLNCFKVPLKLSNLVNSQNGFIQEYVLTKQHSKCCISTYNLKKAPDQYVFPKSNNTSFSLCDKKAQSLREVPHIPVLCQEVCEALKVKENRVYLDMTLGAGGHTQMILERHPSVKVYGLDRDPYIRKFADDLKELFPNQIHSMTGKFSDLPKLLHERKIGSSFFAGVLMDLGPSSMQLDNPERGFMISKSGPLDMRMDGQCATDTLTASEILAHIDEESLYRVLKYYGQEKKARTIARAIVESRLHFKYLSTTEELAELVVSVTGIVTTKDKLQRFSHPATKTFQALRILVNDELNQLDCGLRLAHYFLQTGGVLAAISFHSLEDTILKRHFTGTDLDKTPDSIGDGIWKHGKNHLYNYTKKELEEDIIKPWRPVTKHVITPSEKEVQENPRSRSAKLRVASKLFAPNYSVR